MSDNATSSLKVELLDGNNWFTFRPAMTARFQQCGLWRVVTGNILLPPIPVYFVTTGNPVVPLTAQEVLANSTLENNFDRKNNSWFDKDKKGCGDLLAHVLVTQRVHIKGESTTYAMWQVLIKVHVQQVPGMCFNAYNNMFSIAKAPGKDLTSVATRVEQSLACIQQLCLNTVTDSSGASIAYGVQHLDNNLALMALFQVEQTEHNASRGPLYTPDGDTALRTQDTRHGNRPAPSGTPTTPGKGCAFCKALNHEEASCWAKECAADVARARTKELQEERSKNKKAGCASRAATAAAGTSTGTATKPTVTKSAARASVRLAGTHNTHADAHWIADSGATSHMSTQRRWFKTFEPHVVPIRVANDAIVYSEGIGLIVMEPLDKSLDPVCLSCVLYVPALQNNLFAVLHLVTSHCFQVVIEGTVMEFLRNGVRILTATIRDKTAWLDVRTTNAPESALRGETIRDRSLWHRRLGHIGKDLLEKVIKGKLASGLHLDSDAPLLVHCEPCIVGKHHANPFPAKASHRATRMLEHVHSDLHMVPTATASGCHYWMTFINNWSRYGWIYLLKHKSDTFKAFRMLKAMVKKQYDLLILCFHKDKGGEYIGHVWTSSSQNTAFDANTLSRACRSKTASLSAGTALSRRTLLQCSTTLTCLSVSGARRSRTTRGCSTCAPAIPSNTTPYEMANKRKPDYSMLCIFGCRAWGHVRKDKRKSLEPHAKPCVFLGIPDNFKGWKLWDPLAQGGRGGMIISRDVVWNEEEFPVLIQGYLCDIGLSYVLVF
jgi:hypothetical protein